MDNNSHFIGAICHKITLCRTLCSFIKQLPVDSKELHPFKIGVTVILITENIFRLLHGEYAPNTSYGK